MRNLKKKNSRKTYFLIVCLNKALPKPINKLNNCPAKHPVTAITPNPIFERAEFAK